MTHRERMLAAIRGEPVDRLPWVPRLDLWYNANRRAGTLPTQFRGGTLFDILDALGAGLHAVIPDLKDLRSPDDEVDRALGIYNLRTMPYRTVLAGVARDVHRDRDRTRVRYRTPAGDLETVALYDDTMRDAGITISHIERHAFQSPDDYAPLCHIFRCARVVPQFDAYAAWADEIGDRGVPVAYIALAASPAQFVMRDLMPLDTFFFEMHDRPDRMRELFDAVACYYAQLLDLAPRCPADAVLVGANYDASVTYPPFFAEHITPWLRRFADALHARGKFLLTHADGENDGLLDRYLASGIDIADSICPKPMTRLSFRAVREAFRDRVTIMGGIPSVALLPSAMSDRDFEALVDEIFDAAGDSRRLILGIADTTPPAADFARLIRIADRAQSFRPH